MTSRNILTNKDKSKEEIMLEIVKLYGNRLKLKKIFKKNNKYILSFDYIRPFQLFDETEKKIYIRAIKIKDIYSLETDSLKNISLPINEINNTINNYFNFLQQEISKKVLLNKGLILNLLDSNNTFGHVLNRLSKIILRLIEDSFINKDYVNQIVRKNKDDKRYFKLLENSDYIILKKDRYYPTNKFNKILDESKYKNSKKYSKNLILYNILKENYDYLVYELKLSILKYYIDLLSVFIYLKDYHKLGAVNLSFNGIYETYITLFRKKENKYLFEDKINELMENNILTDNYNLNESYV